MYRFGGEGGMGEGFLGNFQIFQKTPLGNHLIDKFAKFRHPRSYRKKVMEGELKSREKKTKIETKILLLHAYLVILTKS